MYNRRRRVSEPGAGASGLWMDSPCQKFSVSSFRYCRFLISTFDRPNLSRAISRISHNPRQSLLQKRQRSILPSSVLSPQQPRALNRRRRARHTGKAFLNSIREKRTHKHIHTRARIARMGSASSKAAQGASRKFPARSAGSAVPQTTRPGRAPADIAKDQGTYT